VGDNVLVIWDKENNEPEYVETFHPKWIGNLTGIFLPDKNIHNMIEQYYGQSVESFCATYNPYSALQI
jgi:hypothetical protein